MQQKINTKRGLIAGIVGAVIIILIIGSYIWWKQSRRTLLTISLPQPDVQLFINKEQENIPPGSTEVSYKFAPGSYIILVNKSGYWPWGTTAEIGQGPVTLTPFILPQHPTTTEIAANSTEYNQINALFNSHPTASSSITSKDGSIRISANNQIVTAENISGKKNPDFCVGTICQSTVTVFTGNGDTPISSIDFLNDSNNILLIASDKQVFGLEIAQFGRQNFEPIYEGTHPQFIKKDNGSIYVRDNGKIYLVSLK